MVKRTDINPEKIATGKTKLDKKDKHLQMAAPVKLCLLVKKIVEDSDGELMLIATVLQTPVGVLPQYARAACGEGEDVVADRVVVTVVLVQGASLCVVCEVPFQHNVAGGLVQIQPVPEGVVRVCIMHQVAVRTRAWRLPKEFALQPSMSTCGS